MADDSRLDLKYFIDPNIYNCPFCKRRHVSYKVDAGIKFDWTFEKPCWIFFVVCHSCGKKSMHFSYENLDHGGQGWRFKNADLDSAIFYSVPTSFFVMDSRIPNVIRELVTEAEGSLKMNFLTGASACTRKAIYELLVREKAEGSSYEDKIKSLKKLHPNVDAVLFDILGAIQDMTSDKVHEQSWPKWDSKNLKLILETLKAVLQELYVVPAEKAERAKQIRELQAEMRGTNKGPNA